MTSLKTETITYFFILKVIENIVVEIKKLYNFGKMGENGVPAVGGNASCSFFSNECNKWILFYKLKLFNY